MPQPLRKIPRGLDDSPRALKRRPYLLGLLVKTINRWSSLESSLCMLLALLLKIETTVAADLFFSTVSLPLRLDMIRGVAKTTLNKRWRDRLNEILESVRSAARQRNLVAHSGWAVCRSYPDALIRKNAYSLVSDILARGIAARNAIERGETPKKYVRTPAGLTKYDERDLIAILNAVEDADVEVLIFVQDLINDRSKHLPEYAEWRARHAQDDLPTPKEKPRQLRQQG